MDRPTDGDRASSSNTGAGQHRRKKRRRTVLNLGMPFAQVDDFLNQGEDAVILGYRVLEKTVEEIKNGYKDAQEFNRKREEFEERQRAYDRGERDGPPPVPPAIPWGQLVARAQNLQEFALQGVKDGTDIFIDSLKSGMESVKGVAKTWEQSRADVDAKPALAGPVFDEPILVTASPGQAPEPVKKSVRHRGLARLRIHAEVNPPLQELQPFGTGAESGKAGRLHVKSVTFQPQDGGDDEDFSELIVDVGEIRLDQKAGEYEGLITARNFQLLIATLRVRVVAPEKRATDPTSRPAAATAASSQTSSQPTTARRAPSTPKPRPKTNARGRTRNRPRGR